MLGVMCLGCELLNFSIIRWCLVLNANLLLWWIGRHKDILVFNCFVIIRNWLLIIIHLVLSDLIIQLKFLQDHLLVLLVLLIGVFFRFLVLLIPAPLVYLWFSETSCHWNLLASFLRPIWVFIILLHQIVHLVRVFAISLLSVGLTLKMIQVHISESLMLLRVLLWRVVIRFSGMMKILHLIL